jgi:hypothetical protein
MIVMPTPKVMKMQRLLMDKKIPDSVTYYNNGDYVSAYYLIGLEDGLRGYKSNNATHEAYQRGWEDGAAELSDKQALPSD